MREELTGNQCPSTPHLDIEEERPVAVFQGRAPHGGRGRDAAPTQARPRSEVSLVRTKPGGGGAVAIVACLGAFRDSIAVSKQDYDEHGPRIFDRRCP
jgi:hypothetical protein